MKPYSSRARRLALAAALALCIHQAARAGTYLVCYLPPDSEKRLIRFCPGASDAEAGQPCQCLLPGQTLAGTMTRVSIPETGSVEPTPRTICLPQSQPEGIVTLCPGFRSEGDTGCACESGEGRGETYAITFLPRIPVRTNQTAAADFLTRLKECCVSK
jgi:hypothetical protein